MKWKKYLTSHPHYLETTVALKASGLITHPDNEALADQQCVFNSYPNDLGLCSAKTSLSPGCSSSIGDNEDQGLIMSLDNEALADQGCDFNEVS